MLNFINFNLNEEYGTVSGTQLKANLLRFTKIKNKKVTLDLIPS
jgi:hypothetical protein